MAAKTLKSLFTPISVRLRSRKSHDYRRAHSLGFNDDSWASDESVENTITSTPSFLNKTTIPESQELNDSITSPKMDESSSSITHSNGSILLSQSQSVSNGSILLLDSQSLSQSDIPSVQQSHPQHVSNGSILLLESQAESQADNRSVSNAMSQSQSVSNGSILLLDSQSLSQSDSPSVQQSHPQYANATNVESASDSTLIAAMSGHSQRTPDDVDTNDCVPVSTVRALFRSMEQQIVTVIHDAQKNEVHSRLSASIIELKSQLTSKDATIKDLKRQLAQKSLIERECDKMRSQLSDASNARTGLSQQVKVVEAQLVEARKQITSLEDINRALVSQIVPVIPPDDTQSVADVDPSPLNANCDQPHPAGGTSQPPGQSELPERPSSHSTGSANDTPGPSNDSADNEDNPDGTQNSHIPPSNTRINDARPPPTDTERAQSLSKENIDILYVGNSQFRYLHPNKTHRDLQAEVHVLSDKTIDGAIRFFSDYKPSRAPKAVALQVISNTLETELDANSVMTKVVELTSIIARHCPETEIAIGVPLPRLCATPDITSRYDICRDQVEERLKGLAGKRHRVSIVWSPELGSHDRNLFRDNKHLTNFSQNGHLSGLGVLIRAYKSVIYPRINGPRSHQQPQREPWQNRRHSSQQGGRRFWNSTSSNSVQQRGFPQRRAYNKPNYRDSQYSDFTGAQQPTSSQYNDHSGAQQPFSQPRTYMYNSNRTADIEDPYHPSFRQHTRSNTGYWSQEQHPRVYDYGHGQY